jgi:putative transposase
MPRANRYILPGRVYHLTHRCHDRQFLLRFGKDRDGYRRRLREAVRDVDASLLTYNITSNHVHLLAYADDPEQVATLIQQAAGEFAREYNRRKGRSESLCCGPTRDYFKELRLTTIAEERGAEMNVASRYWKAW